MASTKLNIHIQPDANPDNLSRTIDTLSAETDLEFSTSRELLEFLDEQNIASRIELPSTATSMGVLERVENGIGLSPDGNALAKIKEDVRGDLFHFLMYSGWDARSPMEFLQSWGYRNCCDRYWVMGEVELTSSYLDRQVEETINQAYEIFSELNVPEFDDISFSRKSLTGAHKWLLPVQPQVTHPNDPDFRGERVFRRRDFCPPELLVLALAWVLRSDTDVVGVDVLLTREKREAICKACLLSPEALDRVLDWAIPTFPEILSPGTSAGFYGRFVRLHKLPTMEDLIR